MEPCGPGPSDRPKPVAWSGFAREPSSRVVAAGAASHAGVRSCVRTLSKPPVIRHGQSSDQWKGLGKERARPTANNDQSPTQRLASLLGMTTTGEPWRRASPDSHAGGRWFDPSRAHSHPSSHAGSAQPCGAVCAKRADTCGTVLPPVLPQHMFATTLAGRPASRPSDATGAARQVRRRTRP